MKKNMMFAMLALLVAGCAGDDKEKMLTAEQKACVKQHKCEKVKGAAAAACEKKAIEACTAEKADRKVKVDSKGRRRELDRTNK